MNNKLINNDLLEEYNQEGYVVLREVLPPSLTEEAREHVKWLLNKYPDRSPELLTQDFVRDDLCLSCDCGTTSKQNVFH
jgi:hypothetical protein